MDDLFISSVPFQVFSDKGIILCRGSREITCSGPDCHIFPAGRSKLGKMHE
jgi:hypothetical protein